MDGFTRMIRDFLKAHPEHIPDHKVGPIRGVKEHLLDAQALPTFLERAVRHRGADPVKAVEMAAAFRERFPEQRIRALRFG